MERFTETGDSDVIKLGNLAYGVTLGLALATLGVVIAAYSGKFNPPRAPEDPSYRRLVEESKSGPSLEEVTKHFGDDPKKTYLPEGE